MEVYSHPCQIAASKMLGVPSPPFAKLAILLMSARPENRHRPLAPWDLIADGYILVRPMCEALRIGRDVRHGARSCTLRFPCLPKGQRK
jgi:hypothetical protein